MHYQERNRYRQYPAMEQKYENRVSQSVGHWRSTVCSQPSYEAVSWNNSILAQNAEEIRQPLCEAVN